MTEPKITMEAAQPVVKNYISESKALKNGDVESYVSTEDPDRVGDVILAAGWQLDNYRKTGSPVLFGHHYGITPGGGIPHIGNAIEMEVQGKGLWSVTRFHEKTQLSRESAMLAREGIMPAWSVGFNPTKAPKLRRKDDEEDGEIIGFVFDEVELLEYSLVPVPCNPECTSRAAKMYQKGTIGHAMFTLIRDAGSLHNPPAAQPVTDGDDAADDILGHFTRRAVASHLKTRIGR